MLTVVFRIPFIFFELGF